MTHTITNVAETCIRSTRSGSILVVREHPEKNTVDITGVPYSGNSSAATLYLPELRATIEFLTTVAQRMAQREAEEAEREAAE